MRCMRQWESCDLKQRQGLGCTQGYGHGTPKAPRSIVLALNRHCWLGAMGVPQKLHALCAPQVEAMGCESWCDQAYATEYCAPG